MKKINNRRKHRFQDPIDVVKGIRIEATLSDSENAVEETERTIETIIAARKSCFGNTRKG